MKTVLDHGYIKLVETWGSDERIIEAARMSTAKGFNGWGPNEQCRFCGGDGSGQECCATGTGHDIGPYGPPGDEKLLRYLWENKHSTPFEMAGAIVEVQAPIFVFREWHRHRTQCITGDAMITCVTPNGTSYQRSIKSIFDLKHGGVVDTAPQRTGNGTSRVGKPVTREARRKHPWRTRVLPNCQSRLLRVLNESSGEFETAPMADVWEAGVRTVLIVTTSSGRSLRATAEHPFFTRRGWVKMGDLQPDDQIARVGVVASADVPVPPALRSGIGVWTSMMRARLINDVDACYLCNMSHERSGLELDHVIPVSVDLLRALDPANLRPICERCHRNKTNAEQPTRVGQTRRGVRWDRIASAPQEMGEEMTYDIEVAGEHHNYVANGLVVHNSYNEMSARYTPLPDVNYIPSVERLMMGADGKNRQAGTIAGAGMLTERGAEMYRVELAASYAAAEKLYQTALVIGIPKELARVHLPVGRYSRMRASANLRNWLAFLSLRSTAKNHAAQWEIRQFADALHGLLVPAFPRTMALFDQ